MLIYLARRLALAVVTCSAISVLTFVIIRLPPGDFVDAYIANLAVGGSSVSAEQAAAMRREYGLDRPVVVQYGLWMIPNFLLALILMYLGFRYLGLSVGGLFSPDLAQAPWSWAKFWDLMVHLPLPACVLALAGTAQLIRIMRANLLDELRKPYVVTASAKGIGEMRVLVKYPVRAALNPFVSSSAYLFPYLVSGSIVVSLVLGLPTVGPLLLQALVAQDMFLAGTIVLLLGIMTVVGTLISDMLLMWIEPRLRLTGRS